MDCSERYFVSFAIEEHVYSLPQLGNAIGIDVGINEENLAKRQRQLSKKVKGSKNRAKAKLKVAKIHAKILDSRSDFNNKLTMLILMVLF